MPDSREPSPAAKSAAALDPAWAWRPYAPDAQRPWNLCGAGHLYRRAAFGAAWEQLQKAVSDGPQQSIDRLLHPEVDVAAFNRTYDEHETAAIDPGSGSIEGLAQWWLRRMVLTPHPLLEKMTLFWHHAFGTSNLRVGRSLLMQQHVQTLRRHALGRFPPLVEEIVRDPATLMSLDAEANRKAQPNENLARAVLEEFTVGPEQRSPADLREAARAFTGWFVLRGSLRYLEREHDSGPKTILGQTGPWKSEDAARIAATHPAAAPRVVRRLYRWLISETEAPSDALIAPLAESFANDQDIRRLVETMLRSNLFFSPVAYRQRIKSPVEFALGIIRGLEVLAPTSPLAHDLAGLGQKLGQPPTVRGWPEGPAWLNEFTLIRRGNLAAALLAGSGPYGEKIDPAALATKRGFSSAEAAGRFFVDLFLQGDVEEGVLKKALENAAGEGPSGGASRRVRALVHLLVTLPEFQLA